MENENKLVGSTDSKKAIGHFQVVERKFLPMPQLPTIQIFSWWVFTRRMLTNKKGCLAQT